MKQSRVNILLPAYLWEVEAQEIADKVGRSRNRLILEALSKYLEQLREEEEKKLLLELETL